jgi:hypothetical protein
MAGPVNGLGGQQQVPLSQPFQPGAKNEQVREEPKSKKVESQSAKAADSNRAEKEEEQNLLQQLLREAQEAKSGSSEKRAARRGSLVDVTV